MVNTSITSGSSEIGGRFGASFEPGATARPVRIGEILVAHGVLSGEQVTEILEQQKRTARPFGDLAERLFGVSPREVEEAWVRQYYQTVGVTDLRHVRIDPACVSALSRRQAWQFHLLPLNRDDGELALATDELNLARALNFATVCIEEGVHLLIADRRQLREHLMVHYPVPLEIARFSERLGGA